jgi:hypothetical protein
VGLSRISVRIDRLVLPEMDARDRKALVDGLHGELTRVLSDPATRASWAKSHRTPVLRLGRMPIKPGPSGGRAFGTALGHSIGKGLKP